ncbi:hypothetical protein GCM10009765_76000 [Fodinicola feengrottensis]|uniref:Peptidase S53 domain-containing protein n=1 Tax=Fodinicola feengrottensis TaxID=435914 RepID=A0ABN2J1H9_9ACTN
MAHALFRRTAAVAAGLAAIAALAPLTAASPAAAAARTPLADHGPSVPAGSHRDGPLSTSQRLGLAISLRPHDEAGLTNFVAAVSNPASPAYRHYLTSDQYGRYFGPRQSDVDKVRAYLKDSGLTVTAVSGNRQVVDATGTADQVKAAFGTGISDYAGKNGQHFYANDSAPSVPSSLASTIRGVAGLTNQQAVFPVSTPAGPGGPGGGYTPAQLRTAYSMKSLSASYNGSGQTVGLIEFDAFKQSDLTAWTNYYSQPAVTPTVVPIDGGVSGPGSNQLEVTLDVEAVAATAPGAKQVVYEAGNTDSAWVDEMAKIASDNAITVLSGSWLNGEKCASAPIQASHDSYTQMAAQGITMLSASGDWGATGCGYNGDNSTVETDFPASDPLFTGVGGTQLRTSDSAGTYQSESCWNQGSSGNTRSGGGYSSIFAKPDWQPGSNAYRSVPDVALLADYGAGALSVYMNGNWEDVGGTSLSSPLWAGYIAMVNEKATAGGKSNVGAINPTVYSVAQSSQYSSTFRDVTAGNNGTYNAGTGYDLCTGWGSMQGDNLADPLANGAGPAPTNDFSMSASPSSVTVDPGKSVTTTVGTTVTKGSAESVALSATGLPTGVTATFDPTSVTAGQSSTLTLTAAASATGGTSNISVSGKSTDVTHSAAVALTVTGGSPGGQLTVADPGLQFTQHGQSVTLPMRATGGTGSYAWSASGLPAGLSVDSRSGVISGRPSATGAFQPTVTATDAGGATGKVQFTWFVY